MFIILVGIRVTAQISYIKIKSFTSLAVISRPRAILAACTGVNFRYRASAWISIKSKFTGRAFFFLNVARLIWRYFAIDSSDIAYLS